MTLASQFLLPTRGAKPLRRRESYLFQSGRIRVYSALDTGGFLFVPEIWSELRMRQKFPDPGRKPATVAAPGADILESSQKEKNGAENLPTLNLNLLSPRFCSF